MRWLGPGLFRWFILQIDFQRPLAAGMADQLAFLGAELRRLLSFSAFVFGYRFDWLGRGWQFPDQCAARDLNDQVLAGVPVHAFAHARFAGFGDEARRVKLGDQIVQVMVRLQDDVAATAAVAAAGAALGDKSFAMKRDAAFAAMAGAGIYFDLINK